MNIFLDDERKPTDVTWQKLPDVCWQIIRNFDDFVNFVKKNGPPENVSFDHDLAEAHYPYQNAEAGMWFQLGIIPYDRLDGKTGYDAAKWLCDYCQEKNVKFPNYTVHSMNPIGAENIKCYIENWKKHCEK